MSPSEDIDYQHRQAVLLAEELMRRVDLLERCIAGCAVLVLWVAVVLIGSILI